MQKRCAICQLKHNSESMPHNAATAQYIAVTDAHQLTVIQSLTRVGLLSVTMLLVHSNTTHLTKVQELIKRVYNTSPFKSYPLDFMANMNPFASSGNYTNRRGIAACKRGWGIGHPIVIIPGARHNPGHALAHLRISKAWK